MAIRASSSKHIDALIANLGSPNEVSREAAIARLIVIGTRSVDRLIALASSQTEGRVRAAALRALEGIGDERALPVALGLVEDPDANASRAAIAVARRFLRGPKGAAILERLTTVALDTARPESVRVSAVSSLRDLKRKTVAPLMNALAVDPNAAVRAAAQGGDQAERTTDGPDAIREWIGREGTRAPLSALVALVERLREREALDAPSRRADWSGVRFAAHLALARRRSRVALYDLRESLAAAKRPLPADALAALALIGDASCLESVASAYARSNSKEWRDQLLEAFQTIVKREKLTPRHAVMKKALRRLQ